MDTQIKDAQDAVRAVAQLAAAAPSLKEVEAVCSTLAALENHKNELQAAVDSLRAAVVVLGKEKLALADEVASHRALRDTLAAEVKGLRERLSSVLR